MASTQAYVLYGPKDLRREERELRAAGPGDALVKVRAVGICGSDVHYYKEGKCGVFKPSRPFVPGHEFAGVVEGTGARVAVFPLLACGACPKCRAGKANLCPTSRFIGSARLDPTDGAYGRTVVAPAKNCHELPEGMSFGARALLEPLAVAIHAADRAGTLEGRQVLVTGGGTVGQLIAMVARTRGAGKLVVSDLFEAPRTFAKAHGADGVFDPRETPPMKDFDVAFEASGSPKALSQALELTAKGGRLVQVGTLPDEVTAPINLVMSKEISLLGSFNYVDVYPQAIDLAVSGKVDLEGLRTQTFPFDRLVEAIEKVGGGGGNLKIQVEME